jgi:hypothetical protein
MVRWMEFVGVLAAVHARSATFNEDGWSRSAKTKLSAWLVLLRSSADLVFLVFRHISRLLIITELASGAQGERGCSRSRFIMDGKLIAV